jgi:hypothetical protein
LAKGVWNSLTDVIEPMQKAVSGAKKATQTAQVDARKLELQWQGMAAGVFELFVSGLTSEQRSQSKENKFKCTPENQQVGSRLCGEHSKMLSMLGKAKLEKARSSSLRFLMWAEALRDGQMTVGMMRNVQHIAQACLFKRGAVFKKTKMNLIFPDETQALTPISLDEGNPNLAATNNIFPSSLLKVQPQNSKMYRGEVHKQAVGDAELKRKPWSLDSYKVELVSAKCTEVTDMLQSDEVEYKKLLDLVMKVYTGLESTVEVKSEEDGAVSLVVVERGDLKECLQKNIGSSLALLCLDETEADRNEKLGVALVTASTPRCGQTELRRLTDALSLTGTSVVQECVKVALGHWQDYSRAIQSMVVIIRAAQLTDG